MNERNEEIILSQTLDYFEADTFDRNVIPRFGTENLVDGNVLGVCKASAIKCIQHLWKYHDPGLYPALPSFPDALPVICQVYDANLPYVDLSTGETFALHTVGDFADFAIDTMSAVLRLQGIVFEMHDNPKSSYEPIPPTIHPQLVGGAVHEVATNVPYTDVSARRVQNAYSALVRGSDGDERYRNIDLGPNHDSNFKNRSRKVPGSSIDSFLESHKQMGDLTKHAPSVLKQMLLHLGYTDTNGEPSVVKDLAATIYESDANGVHPVEIEDTEAFETISALFTSTVANPIVRNSYNAQNPHPWQKFVNLYNLDRFPLSVTYAHARDSNHKFGLVITADGRLLQAQDFGVYSFHGLEDMVQKGSVNENAQNTQHAAREISTLIKEQSVPVLVAHEGNPQNFDLAQFEAYGAVLSEAIESRVLQTTRETNNEVKMRTYGDRLMAHAVLGDRLSGLETTDRILAVFREVNLDFAKTMLEDIRQVGQGTRQINAPDEAIERQAQSWAKAGNRGFSLSPDVWNARRTWHAKDSMDMAIVKNTLQSHAPLILEAPFVQSTYVELLLRLIITDKGMSLIAGGALPDKYKAADMPVIPSDLLAIVAQNLTVTNMEKLDRQRTGAEIAKAFKNFDELREKAKKLQDMNMELNFQWVVAIAVQLAILLLLRLWSVRHKYSGYVADILAFVYIALTLNVNLVNPILFIIHAWDKLVRLPGLHEEVEQKMEKLQELGIQRRAKIVQVRDATDMVNANDTQHYRAVLTTKRNEHGRLREDISRVVNRMDNILTRLEHFRPVQYDNELLRIDQDDHDYEFQMQRRAPAGGGGGNGPGGGPGGGGGGGNGPGGGGGGGIGPEGGGGGGNGGGAGLGPGGDGGGGPNRGGGAGSGGAGSGGAGSTQGLGPEQPEIPEDGPPPTSSKRRARDGGRSSNAKQARKAPARKESQAQTRARLELKRKADLEGGSRKKSKRGSALLEVLYS